MISEPQYGSLKEKWVDTQYKDCLRQIREYGRWTKSDKQTEGTLTRLNLPLIEFHFFNGFPILTERKIGFWRKPIQELFAFINGVRDARVLAEEWGVNWWMEKWATPEKCADFGLEPYDMGSGSYGPGFATVPNFEWENVNGHPDGGRWVRNSFNQFEHLIRQIKTYPSHRTHRITSWIPQYCLQHDKLQRKVVVAPCHGDIQITIINEKLTLRMDQRSADFPIGVPSNMIQYAALTLALASITGYKPETFIYSCHDSQIYERHFDDVDEILKRESMIFPNMYLTEEGKKLTSIFDFRAKHFDLRDYNAQQAMTLADAVV